MTVRIKSQTRVKSQTLVGFPPQPALNLNFTQGYANGLNPLPSTVTFTRNDAGAYATQVGPDGLLRLAAHNIFTYSADFTNASWARTSVAAPTPDSTSAPDGTITADTVQRTGASNSIGKQNVLSADRYTISIFVKAGTMNRIRLTIATSGYALGATCDFNIATGAYTITQYSTTTGSTASLQAAGNGWFRVSLTVLATAANYYTEYSLLDDGTLYIWGAQLERNLTPSYYVPTTTAAVYANTPRFDYSPVTTEPLGLLIEEARTNNRVPSANYVTSIPGMTVTSNNTAPDGTSAAYGFTENTATIERSTTTTYSINSPVNLTQGQTVSFYVKRTSGSSTRYIAVLAVNVAAGGAFYDLSAVTATVNSASDFTATITGVGNGFYRCTITRVNATSQDMQLFVTNVNTPYSGSKSYTGDGVSQFVFWGFQLETGSFATSYIPTTSGPVTRAVESATMTGTNFSSWYSATAGTFLSTAATVRTGTAYGGIFEAGNASGSERISVGVVGVDGYQSITAGGSTTALWNEGAANNTNAYANTAFKKIAIAAQVNSANRALSGTLGTLDTSVTMPAPDTLFIGNDFASRRLNGWISSIQYWPARFTDAQLQLISKV